MGWFNLMTVAMVHVKENMNPKTTVWMKLSSFEGMLVSDVDTNVSSFVAIKFSAVAGTFGFVQLISSLTPVV